MKWLRLLLVLAWVTAPGHAADPLPAKGMFLVATGQVRGSDFEESVVLLLAYDEDGAAGLIVNKPTLASPAEVVPELSGIDRYEGVIWFGGPVSLNSIQALQRTDEPPTPSEQIVDDVYVVPMDVSSATDASGIRFYVGYSGWSPGQLDAELLRGAWHVVPAAADHVFSTAPDELWERLSPPETLQAGIATRPIQSPVGSPAD